MLYLSQYYKETEFGGTLVINVVDQREDTKRLWEWNNLPISLVTLFVCCVSSS